MRKNEFIEMLQLLDDDTEICALDPETLEFQPVTGMAYSGGPTAELCTDSDEEDDNG